MVWRSFSPEMANGKTRTDAQDPASAPCQLQVAP